MIFLPLHLIQLGRLALVRPLTIPTQSGRTLRVNPEKAGLAKLRARKLGWGYNVLQNLPAHLRLALEMGAHESQEVAAAQGELAQLEARWREAEEIAAIADDLALPDWVRASLARLKRQAAGDDDRGTKGHGPGNDDRG